MWSPAGYLPLEAIFFNLELKRMPNIRRTRWLLPAAGSVIAALMLASQLKWGSTVFTDDPFISYRYAQNLVAGHGLVFNPGERVEGYTNFLWTMMLAGGIALGIDPVPLSKVAGILSELLTLAVVIGCGARISPSPWGPLAAALALIANRSYITWGGGGLEAPLFGLLTVCAVCVFIRSDTRWGLASAGVFSALAALTRPEGALLPLAIAVVHVARARREHGGREAFRGALALAAGFLAVFLPHFIWRLAYYGYPLPNTFYAKVGGNIAGRLARGSTYTIDFFRDAGDVGLLAATIVSGWRWRRERAVLSGWRWRRERAVIIYEGGDWMPHNRFFVPFWPLFALAIGRAVLALGTVPTQHRWLRWTSRGLSLALLAYIAAQPILPKSEALTTMLSKFAQQHMSEPGAKPRPDVKVIGQTLQWRQPEGEHWMDAPRALGLWLRDNAPGAVIALGSIGIIPYYSELTTIDFFGITDEHIAHGQRQGGFTLVGHQKFDIEYLLDRRPDFIIFAGRAAGEADRPSNYWMKVLGFDRQQEFLAWYAPFTIHTEGKTFTVLKRQSAVAGDGPRRVGQLGRPVRAAQE